MKEQLNTEAIFLRYHDFGDTSAVVHLYTRERGLMSCMAKGVKRSGKKGTSKMSYFQPLNLLNVIIVCNPYRELQILSQTQSNYYYKTLHTEILKTTYTLCLAELFHQVLKEEVAHTILYDYLKNALIALDQNEEHSIFLYLHIQLALCEFLGFAPNENAWKEILTPIEYALIPKLLQLQESPHLDTLLNNVEKKQILSIIEHYFQTHVHGFKPLQSPQILKQIL